MSEKGEPNMTGTKASNENPQLDATDDCGGSILGHVWASIGVALVLGVVCCGLYPLAVWAVGQAVFPVQANGSLVKERRHGDRRGHASRGIVLIGQNSPCRAIFIPGPARPAPATTPVIPAARISAP